MISTTIIYKNFISAENDSLLRILGFIGTMQYVGKTTGEMTSWPIGQDLAVKRLWADTETAQEYIDLLQSIYPKNSIDARISF